MNTIFSSARSVQKVVAAIAVFAMVFSPFANIQFASAVTGPIVDPEKFDGNPTCSDIGYGSYETTGNINNPSSPDSVSAGSGTISWTHDGKILSWSATDVKVLAVIMKGGNNANVYEYNPPEATADAGLVSPLNNGGQVPDISHIAFCYEEKEDDIDPEVHVIKKTNVDTDEEFKFSASWIDNGEVDFTLEADEKYESGNIGEGTFSVEELTDSLPDGWSLESVKCESNIEDNNPVNDHTSIPLEDGEIVTCTFTNVYEEVVEVVEPLILTSMCTYPDDGGAKWRVRNSNNDFDVDFTWEIYSNQETGGPLTATHGPAFGAGDTFFDSTLTGTMKIYWDDENSVEQSTSKATNPALCEPEPAEVVAYKIVCTDESEIPNKNDWGGLDPIDENTAQDWVDTHASCDFVEGWQFEWVPNSKKTDPGDTLVGPAGGDWMTFGPTDVNGMTSVEITGKDLGDNSKIWLREVLKKDYLGFSHEANPDNSDDVTAAFFCNNDVLNYDNLEWIDKVAEDETYYCVAWNYIEPVWGCTDPKALNYDEEATHDDNSCEYPKPVCDYGFGPDNLLDNGSFETPEVEDNAKWDIFENGFAGLEWMVDWFTDNFIGTPDPEEGWLELHRGVQGWTPSDGEQYAELDSDWQGPGGPSGEEASVAISQLIKLEEGAKYKLSWDFSPRPNQEADENILEVLVDGTVEKINSAPGGGDVSWDEDTFEFVAGDGDTEIMFRDGGVPNSVGTFLDNAVLCKIADPEPEDPWCTYEGVVVAYTADEDARQNDGDPVDSDRRDITAVETIAPYANFGGKEENDWEVDTLDFFSLGIGGFVTYEFTGDVAYNQPGPDIAIYEITGGSAGTQTNEKVEVEVSEDGINFVSLGDFVGDAAIDIAPAGLAFVKFVRLTDKSQGVQGDNGDGYDLDGIVILNGSCGEEPRGETIEMCKTDGTDRENPVRIGGWGMTLTNYDGQTYELVTEQNGCVSYDVDPDDGPWYVIEEERDGWSYVDARIAGGWFTEGEGDAPVCSFFGEKPQDLLERAEVFATAQEVPEWPEGEEPDYGCEFKNVRNPEALSCSFTSDDYVVSSGQDFTLSWNVQGANRVDITNIGLDRDYVGSYLTSVTSDTTYVLTAYEGYYDDDGIGWVGEPAICTVDIDVSSGGGGGGGGSSRPICRAFELDGDVLSWETSKGFDLEITRNGNGIFSTSDDDVVDEGTYELEDDELALPGDEYELTVFRGSKEDTCTIELDGDGEVLGAATEILPAGAPDTGAGGTANVIPSLPSLLAILGGARRKNG